MNTRVRTFTRPCWALIWLWILSIAQYMYRYIFQVNDARTTSYYSATPIWLSALKYELLLLFFLYGAVRFIRRPFYLNARYRRLVEVTAGGILVLGTVLVVRAAVSPGDFDNTVLCGMQLMPWLAGVLLIPLIVEQSHSVVDTLITFEQIAFWTTFSFWLMTVALAMAGIRYPALSYPGVLLRFGGILDDPNGYACLCLLLAALALGFRRARWMLRTAAYGVMVAGTFSLTGYITCFTICCCLVLFRLYRAKNSKAKWLAAGCVFCAICIGAVVLYPYLYSIGQVTEAFEQIYSVKGSSAMTHLLDLAPAESTLQESSLIGLLFGSGGFSENFYWRVLANFGVIGLFVMAGLALLWFYAGCDIDERWRRTLTAWNIGVLIGSTGIAYLLTFPLGLLFWSALAFLVYSRAAKHEYCASLE